MCRKNQKVLDFLSFPQLSSRVERTKKALSIRTSSGRTF